MWIVLVLAPLFLGPSQTPSAWEERYTKATSRLDAASSSEERFYALRGVAKAAFEVGRVDDAEAYAHELLEMAVRNERNWNHGNAIHDGHMVLGRIALRRGKVEEARRELLLAGGTPGSPQLDSFGPNMSLAKDLILKKDIATVSEYFELCRRFWELESGRLDEWTHAMTAGAVPAFGANLVY